MAIQSVLPDRIVRPTEAVVLMRRPLAGVTPLPALPPAFYIGAEDLGRFLDRYALRVLDCRGVTAAGEPGLRWREE